MEEDRGKKGGGGFKGGGRVGLSPGYSPCIYVSSFEARIIQAFWVPHFLAVESRQPSGPGAHPPPGRGLSSLLALTAVLVFQTLS